MNILLARFGYWMLYIGISLGTILVLGVIMYFLFGLRSKRNKPVTIKIDEEFINNLILYLGGLENITSLTSDNGRVKFTVNSLDQVNGDGLKSLSTNGVFITGNNVKLLFKYDSLDVINNLKERGVK